MKLERIVMAVSLLSVWLLAPSVRAQSGSAVPAEQKDIPTVAITPISSPLDAGTTSGGGTKDVGKSATVTANANAGALFEGWTIGGALGTTYPVTNTLYTNYVSGVLVVTNIIGTNCVGTNVVVTNAPFTIVATTNRYEFTVTTAEKLYANFDWVVTTKVSPTGAGTTTGSGDYTNHANVPLTATATNAWYHFADWTKSGKVVSTNAAYTITNLTAGETLTANFKLYEYAIKTTNSPLHAGHTTGGGIYDAGSKIVVSASAEAGYKFAAWSYGVNSVTNEPYHFTVTSNETLTAYFDDVSVPTIDITSPAHGAKVGASLLQITGTANNILDVSLVVVKLDGVAVPVYSTNKWTNWWAGVLLAPGANEISAYAVSEAGHPSKTNSITVTDTNTGLAPLALAGLIAGSTNNVGGSNWLSFGPATFEQFGLGPNQGSGAGNYTYTQTGPDTATLVSSFFTPPNMATNAISTNFLTFTSPYVASTTNSGATNSGSIAFRPAPDYNVSSPAGLTATAISGNNTITTAYGDTTFTTTNTNATQTNITSGTYISAQYGPVASMIMETNAGTGVGVVETNYIFNFFTNTDSGAGFETTFNGVGAPVFQSGSFTWVTNATKEKYVAPESLRGMSAAVDPSSGGKFVATFGEATLAQTGTTTNDPNALVANYFYFRTGTNTAALYIYDLPPSTNITAIALTFKSSSKAVFSGVSGTNEFTGTNTLSQVPSTGYFAPDALPQAKITPTIGGKVGKTLDLGDGNYTNSASGKTGTYTYSRFSPTVGVITATFGGEEAYYELTFTSSNGGSNVGDLYLVNTNGMTAAGTFTLVK